MSAGQRYEEALREMPDTAQVGMKTAIEALADGHTKIAIMSLKTTVKILEEEYDQ